MEEKNQLKQQLARTITNIANNMVPDIQLLSKIVRPFSKAAAETNTHLTNQLVLATPKDILPIIIKLLSYLMEIIDFKGTSVLILSIISKTISLLKMVFFEEKYQPQLQYAASAKDIELVGKQVVNLVFILNNKYKQASMQLRIVQAAYTLVEPAILSTADYHFITRLFSILFKCCLDSVAIQNISASAIFTLTNIVFAHNHSKTNQQLLFQLLQFTVAKKKCQWIKDNALRSITWDIVLLGVKVIPTKQWDELASNESIVNRLCEMYTLALENSFPSNPQLLPHDIFAGCIRLESQKIPGKRNLMWDYIKCYKVFIYFSIHLSLQLWGDDELVPFRKKFNVFQVLYDYQRSTRFYIILEGICLLIKKGSILTLEEERGIILIDIFQKVCEDLYATKMPFQITWQGTGLRFQKLFDDYNKVTDEDYLKLTKNSLIHLRKGLEELQSSPNKHIIEDTMNGTISNSEDLALAETKQNSISFRWRRLMKSIVRIIRYLTSLQFKQGSNDQAVRKFIMQLQYWFIICPTHKARNVILSELQQNTSNIQTLNQAIKASQCMQICSNIMYGFYSSLNSVGVAIIVRILANIKISYDSGKDFNELDEVCEMAEKFYIEQRIIESESNFKITIEGFVQCINLIIADLHIPSQRKQDGRQQTDKYLKIIDYVLMKLKFVLEQNNQFLPHYWNFIECFWVSLASNKQAIIRDKIGNHIQQVFIALLKGSMMSEKNIMHFFQEMSKLQVLDISKKVIQQIKACLLYFQSQETITSILQILCQTRRKNCQKQLLTEISDIEDYIIKESLFKVKADHSLISIIKSLSLHGKDNNQQYKTVSLLWNISDHLKQLHQFNQDKYQKKIWRQFFAKINQFTKISSYPGTRQSCIHTFTQTIATCRSAIGQQLFRELITTQYLGIFCLLMGFDQEALKLDPIAQVDMEKVAIKNLSKLTKNCINAQDPDIEKLLKKAIENLTTFMKKQGKKLPIEYFIELCQLFQFFKDLNEQDKQKIKETIQLEVKQQQQKIKHDKQLTQATNIEKNVQKENNKEKFLENSNVQQWEQQEQFTIQQPDAIAKNSQGQQDIIQSKIDKKQSETYFDQQKKQQQQFKVDKIQEKQNNKSNDIRVQKTQVRTSNQQIVNKQESVKVKKQESIDSDRYNRLINIACVRQALQTIQHQHQYLDHNTYYWKKKYEPLFNQIKQYFLQQ